MMGVVVWMVGFVCGFGVACWLLFKKVEELERQLDTAQRRGARPSFLENDWR